MTEAEYLKVNLPMLVLLMFRYEGIDSNLNESSVFYSILLFKLFYKLPKQQFLFI